MKYRLSVIVETEVDPSDLLDRVNQFGEALAQEGGLYDGDAITFDDESAQVEEIEAVEA